MKNITVNNVTHQITADEDTPLLWVLRDSLQLNGTKFGCGSGLCGTCTVHLDGKAVHSCQIPLANINTQKITTIEAVAESTEKLHPVQQAWLDIDVPQCGYCQSGQIMTAIALLADNPNPDDEAINQAMSGNICRCGTYVRIRAAIKQAAQHLQKTVDKAT